MLERSRTLCRRPVAMLAAALTVSLGSALGASAQQSRSHPVAPLGATHPLNAEQRLRAAAQYGQMPLQFEQNQGQAPSPIRFLSMHGAYEVALTPDRLVLNLKDHGVKTDGTDGLVAMRLAGANPAPAMVGEQELPGKVNYFLGNKSDKWHTGISTFSRVRLKSVYPGVDLVYYGNQKQLEYDFVLQPGANPDRVRLDFMGTRSLHLEANGDLLLHAKSGEMRWKSPEVYQMIDGKRHIVAAHYTVHPERKGKSQVGFEVAQYDHSRPLVIDPSLLVRYYNTLSSASGAINTPMYNSMVADSGGNVYATASTAVASATYATATSPTGSTSTSTRTFTKFPSGANAATYILAIKLNSAGAIVYNDIIGGSAPDSTRAFVDSAQAITIDDAGNAYVLGSVQAPDMPLAGTPYQSFIGFSGNSNVDSQHRHLVRNAYLAKLNAAGSALTYATYFGGRATESGIALAVNGAGTSIYIAGLTPTLSNFPATGGRTDLQATTFNSNGFQTTYGGSFEDGYLARLDGSGSAYTNLVYSTLMGGSGTDLVWGLDIDPSNDNIVYAVGDTELASGATTSDFFHSLTVTGFQTTYTGSDAGFLVKVDTSASGASSFKYGTFIGGTNSTDGTGLGSNTAHSVLGIGSGIVYVAGETNATNFPVSSSPLQSTHGGTSANDALDAFLLKVDTTQAGISSKLYATYFGGGDSDYAAGLAYDGTSIYMAGRTASTSANGNFPTTTGAPYTSNQGGSQADDAFVAKFTDTNNGAHAHTLNFSTYLGGSLDEGAAGIGVDSSSNVYVMGDVTGGTFQSIFFSKLSVNNAPVASAQSVTVTMNTPKAITLTATDADGDTLTYAIVGNPSHGTLSGFNASTGAVTYTPTTGYSGSDSFTFKANDGHDDSNVATVSITVVGAPTANSQTVAVAHNTAKAITLTGSDPNSPPRSLTYSVASSPAHGTLSGTAPNLTYTPTASYQGTDSFTFTVNNGFLTSNTATVTLNVAAGAPTANGQSVTVLHNTAKAITLTGSDPNTPALSLTYAIATNPSHGTLSGFNASTGAVTYTPNAGYSGADSFTFIVNNGSFTSSPATVTLTVNAAAPTANPQTVSVAYNTATPITLTGSDPNVPALTPLTYAIGTNPTHGTLSGFNASTGAVTYTPTAGYSGADSFTFTVTNTGSITSSPATVTLNVAAAPTLAPTANAQTVTVLHNTAKAITLTGSDPNTPALSLTYAIATNPSHGTLSGFNASTGAVTYTPNAGYSGVDSFNFTVNNGSLISSPATVTLNVAAAAPTANSQTVSVAHDTATAVTLTGSDPNVPALSLTYNVTSNPAHGTLSGTAPNLTYTPTAGYSGADSFQFTVTNSAGLTSSAATVTLNVAAATIMAPTANPQSVSTNQETAANITLTGSDPNTPALSLTYAIATNPAHGTLSGFNAATGAVTYTPSAGYSGADSFTFTVNNGSLTSAPATVSITVNAAPTPVEVTASVRIQASGFTAAGGTNYTQTLTITNTGASDIAGPIYLLLDNLGGTGVQLTNLSGTTVHLTPAGRPYITLANGIPAQGSIRVLLKFNNPNRVPITYTPRLFAGQGSM